MDDQTKKDFIDIFNQGFEEVVSPEIEALRQEANSHVNEIKNHLEKVENRLETVEDRLETVEDRLESLERKSDLILGKQLDSEHILGKHDKRITNLENKKVVSV